MSKFFKSILLITVAVMLLTACQPAPTAAPAAAELTIRSAATTTAGTFLQRGQWVHLPLDGSTPS